MFVGSHYCEEMCIAPNNGHTYEHREFFQQVFAHFNILQELHVKENDGIVRHRHVLLLYVVQLLLEVELACHSVHGEKFL